MSWKAFLKHVKSRLFWRLGLVYVALLLLVLVAVDVYTVQSLRHDYVESAIDRLEALDRLISSRIPETNDASKLGAWSAWAARSMRRQPI